MNGGSRIIKKICDEKQTSPLEQGRGRPWVYRWPGLNAERLKILSSSVPVYTRQDQLALAKREAELREAIYSGKSIDDESGTRFIVGELLTIDDAVAASEKKSGGAEEKIGAGEEKNIPGDKKIGADEKNSVVVDLENLKFDVRGAAAHTTIDFGKATDYDGGVALITTNDFVVYNRIKKIMFGKVKQRRSRRGVKLGENGWEIVDIQFSFFGNAVQFITVQCPLDELRLVLNKYRVVCTNK